MPKSILKKRPAPEPLSVTDSYSADKEPSTLLSSHVSLGGNPLLSDQVIHGPLSSSSVQVPISQMNPYSMAGGVMASQTQAQQPASMPSVGQALGSTDVLPAKSHQYSSTGNFLQMFNKSVCESQGIPYNPSLNIVNLNKANQQKDPPQEPAPPIAENPITAPLPKRFRSRAEIEEEEKFLYGDMDLQVSEPVKVSAAPSPTTPSQPSPTTPSQPSPTAPIQPSPTAPIQPSPTAPSQPSPTTQSQPSPTPSIAKLAPSKPSNKQEYEKIHDLLKTIGLDIGVVEIGKLAVRTQERLHGKTPSMTPEPLPRAGTQAAPASGKQDSTARQGHSISNNQDTASKPRDSAPQDIHLSPKLRDTTPKPSDTAPKSRDTTPNQSNSKDSQPRATSTSSEKSESKSPVSVAKPEPIGLQIPTINDKPSPGPPQNFDKVVLQAAPVAGLPRPVPPPVSTSPVVMYNTGAPPTPITSFTMPPTGFGPMPPTGFGPMPPTGLGPIPPTGLGPMPPTGLGPMPPTGLGPMHPTGLGPMHPTGLGPMHPTGMGPMHPTGLGPMHPSGLGPMHPSGLGRMHPSGLGPMHPTGLGPMHPTGLGPMPPTSLNPYAHYLTYPASWYPPVQQPVTTNSPPPNLTPVTTASRMVTHSNLLVINTSEATKIHADAPSSAAGSPAEEAQPFIPTQDSVQKNNETEKQKVLEELEALKSEQNKSKENLSTLSTKVKQLQAQQGILLRKKRREKDGQNDPLLTELYTVMGTAQKQLTILRKELSESQQKEQQLRKVASILGANLEEISSSPHSSRKKCVSPQKRSESPKEEKSRSKSPSKDDLKPGSELASKINPNSSNSKPSEETKGEEVSSSGPKPSSKAPISGWESKTGSAYQKSSQDSGRGSSVSKISGSPEHEDNSKSPEKSRSKSPLPSAPSAKSNNPADNFYLDLSQLFRYYDDGLHWCQDCVSTFTTVKEFLEHMHRKKHWQSVNQASPPWAKKMEDESQVQENHTLSIPLKGVEFLLPTNGFYCRLCDETFADKTLANQHLRTFSHNQKYKKYLEENSLYELKRENKKKALLATEEHGQQKQIKSKRKLPENVSDVTAESRPKKAKQEEESFKANTEDEYNKTKQKDYNKAKLEEKSNKEKREERCSKEKREEKFIKDKPEERYRDKQEERYRDKSEERYKDKSEERYKDKSEERHKDNQEERHKDKQEERHKDKQEERHKDKQEERHKDKQEERHKDKQEERHKDKQEERHKDKQEERYKDKPEERSSKDKQEERSSKDKHEERYKDKQEEKYKDKQEERSNRAKEEEKYSKSKEEERMKQNSQSIVKPPAKSEQEQPPKEKQEPVKTPPTGRFIWKIPESKHQVSAGSSKTESKASNDKDKVEEVKVPTVKSKIEIKLMCTSSRSSAKSKTSTSSTTTSSTATTPPSTHSLTKVRPNLPIPLSVLRKLSVTSIHKPAPLNTFLSIRSSTTNTSKPLPVVKSNSEGILAPDVGSKAFGGQVVLLKEGAESTKNQDGKQPNSEVSSGDVLPKPSDSKSPSASETNKAGAIVSKQETGKPLVDSLLRLEVNPPQLTSLVNPPSQSPYKAYRMLYSRTMYKTVPPPYLMDTKADKGKDSTTSGVFRRPDPISSKLCSLISVKKDDPKAEQKNSAAAAKNTNLKSPGVTPEKAAYGIGSLSKQNKQTPGVAAKILLPTPNLKPSDSAIKATVGTTSSIRMSPAMSQKSVSKELYSNTVRLNQKFKREPLSLPTSLFSVSDPGLKDVRISSSKGNPSTSSAKEPTVPPTATGVVCVSKAGHLVKDQPPVAQSTTTIKMQEELDSYYKLISSEDDPEDVTSSEDQAAETPLQIHDIPAQIKVPIAETVQSVKSIIPDSSEELDSDTACEEAPEAPDCPVSSLSSSSLGHRSQVAASAFGSKSPVGVGLTAKSSPIEEIVSPAPEYTDYSMEDLSVLTTCDSD
uniref:C2H2-type domain-containing protein n=1 Tax=Leptobrachium leishanense TaxID=445787 RepID=A0A8C5N504_9ANUR